MQYSEVYAEPCNISKMEIFAKIVKHFWRIFFFAYLVVLHLCNKNWQQNLSFYLAIVFLYGHFRRGDDLVCKD